MADIFGNSKNSEYIVFDNTCLLFLTINCSTHTFATSQINFSLEIIKTELN